MSVETTKELDDFLRSMRQAYNAQDMKLYRSHFWTDKRFVNLDPAGRTDRGWGSYEEILDQEFRYMESVKLDLKDLQITVFDDSYAAICGDWKVQQVDPEGRGVEQSGRATFAIARVKDDWKIIQQHLSLDVEGA